MARRPRRPARCFRPSAALSWPPLRRTRTDHARIENRFARLEGRRASPDGRADIAPDWRPGRTVPHAELLPFEGTPLLVAADVPWAIVDSYCPDPACRCGDAHLLLVDFDRTEVEVSGNLGAAGPLERGAREHALWRAVHNDRALVATLKRRQDDVRAYGPFIVARHYESVRNSVPGRARPLSREGGYFIDASVTEAAVARVFDAGVALGKSRPWALDGIELRLALSGAISWRGSITLDQDEYGFTLSELGPSTDAREVTLTLELRDELPMPYRAQRIAGRWALADGTLLPVVDVFDPGSEGARAPTVQEMVLATVAAEALAHARVALYDALETDAACEERVTIELGAGVLGEDAPAGVVDVVVSLDGVEQEVAAISETHRDEVANREDGDDDREDDDEDEDRDDEEDDDPHRELRAAAVDWSLHDGADLPSAGVVDLVARTLDDVAREDGPLKAGWTATTVSTFLREYGPRKVLFDERQIDRVPRALEWIVETLESAGHVEPGLRETLDVDAQVFLARARDRSRWGPAKSLVSEMRAAGVDLNDQTAINAYLAEKNRASSPPRVGARVRWVRGPSDPVPADSGPCPCGSGRRFKKCCKRR